MNDTLPEVKMPVPVPQRELQHADPAAVAAAESAKARIQSAYLMALHKKRSVDEALVRINEACRRPLFAEKAEYKKPQGNTSVRGPSIRFAEEIARLWGNTLIEDQVVYDDEHVQRIKITGTDLETNTSYTQEVQARKTVERRWAGADRTVVGQRKNTKGEDVFIVVATEDEFFTKVSAAKSKAIRNVIVRLIPFYIVEEALATARETMRTADAEDPDAAKRRLYEAFFEIGVSPIDIETYLGRRADLLTPAELEDLRGLYQAIRNGEGSWNELTKAKKEPPEDADGGDGRGIPQPPVPEPEEQEQPTRKRENKTCPQCGILKSLGQYADRKKSTVCFACEARKPGGEREPEDAPPTAEVQEEEMVPCPGCGDLYLPSYLEQHGGYCRGCADQRNNPPPPQQGERLNTGIHSNKAQWEILRQMAKRHTGLEAEAELDAWICQQTPGKPKDITKLTNIDAENLMSELESE